MLEKIIVGGSGDPYSRQKNKRNQSVPPVGTVRMPGGMLRAETEEERLERQASEKPSQKLYRTEEEKTAIAEKLSKIFQSPEEWMKEHEHEERECLVTGVKCPVWKSKNILALTDPEREICHKNGFTKWSQLEKYFDDKKKSEIRRANRAETYRKQQEAQAKRDKEAIAEFEALNEDKRHGLYRENHGQYAHEYEYFIVKPEDTPHIVYHRKELRMLSTEEFKKLMDKLRNCGLTYYFHGDNSRIEINRKVRQPDGTFKPVDMWT